MLRIKGFFPYILIIFFNAFVDLGHKILIQNTLYQTSDASHFSLMSSIINGFILLPYLLLFTPSGFIADKFKKVIVLRITAAAAIPLTIIATWSYFQGYFEVAFGVTLLLATQSALNSPSKYGYIKELFGKAKIAKANAVVQTTAIMAILAGTFIFSLIFDHFLKRYGLEHNMDKAAILKAFAPAGFVLIICSCAETIFTFLIPKKPASDPDSTYTLKGYVRGKYVKSFLSETTKSQVIFLSIIGLAIFWGINQVMLASYGAYLKAFAGNPSAVFVQSALAIAGIGILFGASYAGRVSRGFVETGLIPAAAIGICVCLALLSHFTNHTTILVMFFIYGIFGGMLVVPLNSLIQFNAKDSQLGKVMAANNFIQTIFMLGFLAANIAYISLGGNIRYFLYFMVVIAVGSTCYAIYKLPQALLRYMLYFVFSKFYRLRVEGLDNLPSSGGVLLLGNHLSFIDWAILQIASPRPIRFVMARVFFDKWYLRWLLNKMRVIPISSGASKNALAAMHQGLVDGDVVALFPEGRLSRNGQLGYFHSGFERAVKDSGAIIVPFYLLGLWGTSTTYATERYKKLSKSRSRHVSVTFGPGIADDSDAALVKQKVMQLSISAWKTYVDSLGTIPEVWLSRVKQLPSSTSLIDSMGLTLSNIQLLSIVLHIRHKLQKKLNAEQNIGILLPAGGAGIMANMSAFVMGKTVVNLNYTSSEENLLTALQEAKVKTIITAKAFVKKLEKKGYDLSKVFANIKPIYIEEIASSAGKLVVLRNMLLLRLCPLSLLKLIVLKKHDAEQTAAILFSSGSESKPKGIELSHSNIIGNAKQISSVFNIKDNDKMLSVLPLFHAFGLTATTIMPLLEGTPVVCHPDPTDVVRISRLIHKYKVSVMCATSTFLGMYCRNRKVLPQTLESLRLVIAGAEKLSDQVRIDFKQKFSLDVYEGYGATEVAPVASANLPDTLMSDNWQVQVTQKLGTVGLPVPGTAFKIVDPQTLQTLPTNTEGMVLIGGTQVMKGYLNNPEKTKQVLIPEADYTWYITGDKGKLDEDGFLTIVDRYSRFAKVAGEMVSLSAVEQRIEKVIHDSDIELMAINVPDDKRGEKIIVLHTGTMDAKQIREGLQAIPGSNLMIPAAYQQVDAIPKLGTGKKDYSAGKLLLGEL